MTEKTQLIAHLREMGELLELAGENSFKCAAHVKAADALLNFRGDLTALIEDGELTTLAGIGKGMEAKICEYHASGRIRELDELRAKFPPGLVEMTRIPGFGPAKVRQVYEALGVKTIEGLKQACEDGRLGGIKGFGPKSCEKLLKGLNERVRYEGLHRLDKARAVAEKIERLLREHPCIVHAEMAGSIRRAKEVVADLDFVVTSRTPCDAMDFFVSLPDVFEIIGKGDTKTSVQLVQGFQADLRCVAPEQYAYALLHFTGSKEHNAKLRALAKDRGLKLNEYGLFPVDNEESLPAESEASVYRHLGLQYIPPEAREDRGEIEAAAENRFPDLIEETDIIGLMHMHTHYSDGKPAPEDYAKWAFDHGIRWMGIADHSKNLSIARGLTEERVLEQHREIDEVNHRWADKGIRLLKGIECDILEDGSLDYTDDFRKCFEFIVGSVHTKFRLTKKEQTLRMCRAVQDPRLTILGHMTGRLLLAREGYELDQREVIAEAGRNGVAIEINANPRRLDVDWRLIGYALEQGCKLTIGPDAHSIEGLDDTEYGLAMARKGWARAEDVLNSLTAEDFLRYAAR